MTLHSMDEKTSNWNLTDEIFSIKWKLICPYPKAPQLEEFKRGESKAPPTRYLGTKWGGGEWLSKRSGRFFSQGKILRYALDGPQGLAFQPVAAHFRDRTTATLNTHIRLAYCLTL
jgi:hypothetical protein